jgi:thiosulfate/3-mercaptopyruvate sulfurtransferase
MTARSAVPALVDVAWLRSPAAAGVTLLQVDEDSSSFYTGHLPGALPLDWYDELHETVRRGPVSREHFEQLMCRKGIAEDSHVVLCGGGELTFAAHAFWVLRYYGHQRISLLDGGLAAWTRAGLPLDDSEPTLPPPTDYRSPGPDRRLRATRDEVLERYVDAPGPALVLDCRTPAEFEGRSRNPVDLAVEQHRVPGHIPGAVNLPSGLLLTEDGAFQPVSRLLELFVSRGLADDSDVVVYCRVAERSSVLWFSLSELLGHPQVRHYDGGWSEYGSLMDVSVARDQD